MKRYNSVYDGVYTKPNEMVEEASGDWVRWEDVEKLEAINAELLEALAGLAMKAAQHFWRDTVVIRARAAIAKAKGEQP